MSLKTVHENVGIEVVALNEQEIFSVSLLLFAAGEGAPKPTGTGPGGVLHMAESDCAEPSGFVIVAVNWLPALPLTVKLPESGTVNAWPLGPPGSMLYVPVAPLVPLIVKTGFESGLLAHSTSTEVIVCGNTGSTITDPLSTTTISPLISAGRNRRTRLTRAIHRLSGSPTHHQTTRPTR
jgi:hypothetical protein